MEVFTAEFGWELQPIEITSAEIFSAEFGREVETVAKYKIIVAGVEFGYEFQPIEIYSIGVQSAEFSFELPALLITPVSTEFDREAQSARVSINLIAASAEFDREFTSADFPGSITVEPFSAEFGWELRPVEVIPISVDEAEFGREITAAGIGLLQAQSPEFGKEHGDVTLRLNARAITPEFGYEVAGGGPATESFEVNSAEFVREHRSALFVKNLRVTNHEHGFELQPIEIIPIAPASSEYGREISQGFLAGNVASPLRAEFDRAFESVFLGYSASFNLLISHAEFGWELQPFTVITPIEAEFGSDFSSAFLLETGIGQPVEFDREISSVAITVAAAAQADAAEFDREIDSVGISNNLGAVSVEFEREFGSAQISRIIVTDSAELDYEDSGVDVAFSSTAGTNEYEHELGSPVLTQESTVLAQGAEFDWEARSAHLPGFQGTEPTSAEFDWSAANVRLRAFHRRRKTPRDRIKTVVQI